jgi:group I intron endonuclease
MLRINMYIYKIINLKSKKIYIGQTTEINPLERWYGHKSDAKRGKSSALYDAIRKYGPEMFSFEVILKVDSLDQLNLLEQKLITELNSLVPNGYNLKPGGNNHKMSQQTKDKISKSKKGIKNPKISLKLKGIPTSRKPWNKGKKYKRPNKPGFISPILGMKKSENHKINLSIAKIEFYKNNNHCLSKPVLWLDRNIIFESASEAARYFKCKQSHISRVCTGKRKFYKGYEFEYLSLLSNPALQQAAMGNVNIKR